MKNKDLTLDGLFGLEAFNTIVDNPQESLSLFENRFSLSDLNITARVLNHWKNFGLLPEKWEDDSEHEEGSGSAYDGIVTRKHIRFNFFDLVYFYILQDLREFGFSLQNMLNVKNHIARRFDIKELIQLFDDEFIADLKNKKVDDNAIVLLTDFIKNKDQVFDKINEIPEQQRYVSYLDLFLVTTLVNKLPVNIVILRDGFAFYDNKPPMSIDQFKKLYEEPHIVIPLTHYLQRFLSNEKYDKLVVTFKILDEQEKLILDHVRSGRYKEVTIKMGAGKSKTLRLTEELKADRSKRLEQVLVKGAYQELILKTEKGKISYGTMTTKRKI